MESRLGLPCTIGGLSWSPWAGVQVRDLSFRAPRNSEVDEELLQIELIKTDLSWRSLARGKKRFQRMEIQGVSGDLSVELLQSLLARGQVPEEEVEVDAPPPPVVVDEAGSPSEEAPVERPVPGPVEVKSPEPMTGKSRVVPVDDFEGVLVFEKVRLRVFSEKFPELSAGVSGVSGEIPIWGEGSEGVVTIEDLEVGDRYHSQKIEVPVRLTDRFLRVDDYQVKLFGLNFEMSAAIWMVPGLPYGVELELPNQQVDLTPIYLKGTPPFTIGSLQSANQIKGHLLNPWGMTGGSFTVFRSLEIRDGRDGSKTSFQSGSAHFQLSAAGLIARDLRIVGEEEAMMGNGFVTPRGDAVGVVRIVASPNRAQSFQSRVNRASDRLDLKFEPLVTPDREFRDLQLEVRAGELMIDLGQDRQWVPFLPAARAIVGFRDPNISLYP